MTVSVGSPTQEEREEYSSMARILSRVGVGLVLKHQGSSLVVRLVLKD
jgi:hypothetical protein